jgi:hypothetical protein
MVSIHFLLREKEELKRNYLFKINQMFQSTSSSERRKNEFTGYYYYIVTGFQSTSSSERRKNLICFGGISKFYSFNPLPPQREGRIKEVKAI